MPSYQRQHQNHSDHKPPTTQQNPSVQSGAQQEERSGFLGWMQDTGDWVASKYESATNGVGEWIDGVTDSAQNVIDVIQDTSINREDGKWNIDTDLDEVMDLIPSGALQLDREASENKVNIQIDRDKGEVRMRSASLAISGLNINGLQLSSGRLQDVELVITNASAHLPVIGAFTIGSENQKSTATINVGQVIGNNAVYDIDGQTIKADQIHLSNLRFSSETGKEGFGSKSTQGQFHVTSAEIIGFQADETSGDFSVASARGGFNSTEDSGHFAANQVLGQNLAHGSNTLSDAEIAGLSAHISKGDSGHVANVSARSASANNIDSAPIDAQNANVTNLDLQYGLNDGSINASAEQASLTGVDSKNIDASSVAIQNLAVNSQDQQLSASTDSIQVTDLDSNIVDAETISLGQTNTDLSWSESFNISNDIASIEATQLTDIAGSDASIDAISGKDVNIENNNDQFTASLGSLSVNEAAGFGGTLEQGSVSGARVNLDQDNNGTFQLNSGNLTGLDHEHISADAISLNSLTGSKQGEYLQAGLENISGENLQSEEHGSVAGIEANNLMVNTDGTEHQASMKSLQLSNLQDNHLNSSIGSANVKDVNVVGTSLQQLNAELGHGEINDASLAGASIGKAAIQGGQASIANNTAEASLDSAAFQNGRYKDQLHVEGGEARGLNVSGNFEQQTGSVDEIDIQGIHTNFPNVRTDINSAYLRNGQVNHTGKGNGSTQADLADIQGISFRAQDTQTTGQTFNPNVRPVTSELDEKRLTASVLARIDNANIKSQANLISGEYGSGLASATIKEDTQLHTNLLIQNNQLQNGSSLSTTKSVDTPLWTSTDGLYVEDDKMMADVNGWFDINASKKTNNILGMGGSELHSLEEYGRAISNMPASEKKQSDSEKMPNPVDLSTLALQGQVGMSNGIIDAGGASMELAGAENNANQIGFSAAADRMSMAFSQLLASSLRVDTNVGTVQSGESSIKGGNVFVQPESGTANGEIDSVTIKDIKAER